MVVYAGATILGPHHHRQGLVDRRQRLAHHGRAAGDPRHPGRGARPAPLARLRASRRSRAARRRRGRGVPPLARRRAPPLRRGPDPGDHRDPHRLEGEVRARQEVGAPARRPDPLLGRPLPGELRLRPAHLLRRRRPARRPRALLGADPAARHHARQDHRRDEDARRQGRGRQAHRGPRRRPELLATTPTSREIPPHRLRELQRFFQDYKALENKKVLVSEPQGRSEALQVLRDAIALYDRERERLIGLRRAATPSRTAPRARGRRRARR